MRERDEQVIRDALDGRSPDAVVFVATAGDEPVGFIHLCEEEDYYGGPCGHIGDVVVAPAARGKGVGTALIAAGERWARERGYRLLTLNVFLDNEGARALYEELGFRPETVRQVKELD
jgi:GNAT superfamily N-acetyltransferase